MRDRRWRDERSHVLPERIRASGLIDKNVETIIDHIEYDEGLGLDLTHDPPHP